MLYSEMLYLENVWRNVGFSWRASILSADQCMIVAMNRRIDSHQLLWIQCTYRKRHQEWAEAMMISVTLTLRPSYHHQADRIQTSEWTPSSLTLNLCKKKMAAIDHWKHGPMDNKKEAIKAHKTKYSLYTINLVFSFVVLLGFHFTFIGKYLVLQHNGKWYI